MRTTKKKALNPEPQPRKQRPPLPSIVKCPTCRADVSQRSAEYINARLIRGEVHMLKRRYRCHGPAAHEFDQYEVSDEALLLIAREQMRVAEFCNAAQRMFMMMRDIADESLGKRPDQGQFENSQNPVSANEPEPDLTKRFR